MSHGSRFRKLAAVLPVLLLVLAAARTMAQPPAPETTADSTTEGTPRIVAVEEDFDFGQVEQGIKAKHVFTIRNEGDAPLKIIKAKGS